VPRSHGYREKLLVKINDASAKSNQPLAAAGTFCRQQSNLLPEPGELLVA